MTRAHEIAEKFRAAFAADTTNFSGVACILDVDDATFSLPCLVFKVEDAPLSMSGKVVDFTLTIHVENTADGAGAFEAHTALVEKVRAKLHGSGKSALITTLETGNVWDFLGGWSALQTAPGLASQHFRTPIAAAGTARKV